MKVSLPTSLYIAIANYEYNKNGKQYPVFHSPKQTVYASDHISAMTQFDINEVKYIDVMLYIPDNQFNLFEDENS